MEAKLWIGAVTVFVGLTAVVGGGVVVTAESGPLADAGLDQNVTEETTVYLDAGGSVAPDGSLTAYEWRIETPDGTTIQPDCSTCVQTSFVPETVGTYAVSVTVTDDEGRVDTDTLYVDVEPYEHPAVRVEGPTSATVGDEETVTITGTAGENTFSWLSWDGNETQQEMEELDDAGSKTLERGVTFDKPGTQTINATVADELGYQDRDGIAVDVTAPDSFFAVTISEISSPVTAGDPLTVNTTISNLGQTSGTQSVWLTREGTIVDVVEDVSLAPGEDTDVAFTWETAPGDGGTYEFVAKTRNDTDDATATVEESEGTVAAFFSVEYATPPPDQVQPGDSISPTVRVENTGSVRDTQTVTLADIHDYPADSVDVTLEPGESRELTELSWTPRPRDTGTGNLRVTTEDDAASANVSVVAPSQFDINIQSIAAFGTTASTPEAAKITVRIENTGEYAGSRTIELAHTDVKAPDGSSVDPSAFSTAGRIGTATVQLTSGASTTRTFIWSAATDTLVKQTTFGEQIPVKGVLTATTDTDTDSETATPQVPDPCDQKTIIDDLDGECSDIPDDVDGLIPGDLSMDIAAEGELQATIDFETKIVEDLKMVVKGVNEEVIVDAGDLSANDGTFKFVSDNGEEYPIDPETGEIIGGPDVEDGTIMMETDDRIQSEKYDYIYLEGDEEYEDEFEDDEPPGESGEDPPGDGRDPENPPGCPPQGCVET
jgi:hypothetical protein